MTASGAQLDPKELLSQVFGDKAPGFGRETVLDAVFVNYTPYMGGGAYGTTFHCLDPRCKEYTFAAPTGETLKGRMRWLARIAVGTGRGYKLDEEVVKKFFGYVSRGSARASAIQVKITPTTKGKPHASYETIRDILARAFALSQYGLKKPNKVVDLLEQAGYAILAIQHGWMNELNNFVRRVEPILDAAKAASEANEFLKLFTIPRFKLLALKISTEVKSLREIGLPEDKIIDNASRLLFELQPARPNTVKIELEVKVADSLVEPPLDSMRKDVARFSCLLGLAAPILGLGKASARGFGLFWPVKISYSICRKDFPVLKDGADNTNYSKELEGLLKDIAEVAGHLGEHKEKEEVYTPRLNNNVNKALEIDNVVHPCPVNMSLYTKVPTNTEAAHKLCCQVNARVNKDIYLLLSAVGVACLKNVWKLRIEGRIVESRGNCLDTWILGLPRSQKGTGYLLVNSFVLENKNICKYLRVACDKGQYDGYYVYRCKGTKALGKLEPGRRLSNVFTWLSPDYKVVLLPLAAAPDIPLRLEKNKALVHIGIPSKKTSVTNVTKIVLANANAFDAKLNEVSNSLRRLLTGAELKCPNPKQLGQGHGSKKSYARRGYRHVRFRSGRRW